MNVKYFDATRNKFFSGTLEASGSTFSVISKDTDTPTDIFLTPGWIDMHTHIFDGVGLFGTNADSIGYKTGVCLNVDAGTVGSYTIEGFKKYIAPSFKTNYKLFLCISPIGVIFHHEYNALEYLDVNECITTINENRDCISGVKVRIGSETIRHEGIIPLKKASEVARKTDLPLMVHVGGTPPHLKDMVDYFEKGDIITHAFNGRGNNDLWDSDGNPKPALELLLNKGVILDVGHGGGSFDFDVFEKAYSKGLPKILCGSDLHKGSEKKCVYNMGTLLSKLYGCGMTLEDLIYGVTSGPAKVLRLQEWCNMDRLNNATLFKIVKETAEYEDCEQKKRVFHKKIKPIAVILNNEYVSLEN